MGVGVVVGSGVAGVLVGVTLGIGVAVLPGSVVAVGAIVPCAVGVAEGATIGAEVLVGWGVGVANGITCAVFEGRSTTMRTSTCELDDKSASTALVELV